MQPARSAYIGDSVLDIQSAKEVGVLAVAAAWSPNADPDRLLRERPDLLFTTVAQFSNWVLGNGRPTAGSG